MFLKNQTLQLARTISPHNVSKIEGYDRYAAVYDDSKQFVIELIYSPSFEKKLHQTHDRAQRQSCKKLR